MFAALYRPIVFALTLAGALAACGAVWAQTGDGGNAMAMTISSPAFAVGGGIPKRYTGDGDDVSPPLAWSGVPAGANRANHCVMSMSG